MARKRTPADHFRERLTGLSASIPAKKDYLTTAKIPANPIETSRAAQKVNGLALIGCLI
jgi:hypothetical protein